ncbi:MAG: hypothetical protein ACHQ7N_04575 [Candidatus Methylomirabilales bacterium]
MVENTLKRLLKSGGTAIGTMVCDTRTLDTGALGVMDTGHPMVIEYIQRVVNAAKRRGLPSGTHVLDVQTLRAWRDKGMRLLLSSYDFGLIMSGGAAAIQELRA